MSVFAVFYMYKHFYMLVHDRPSHHSFRSVPITIFEQVGVYFKIS